ncbi:HIT family protein [Candidatus Parcubacteria bacterium]|nr:MAG: HIT family protein [Candidatus Parcubacteria bacterium]
MNDNCLFCRIVAGEIPAEKVYENDKVLAFLDIGPVTKGHTLIIPKKHAENLTYGDKDSALALMEAVYDFAPKLIKALGADGYNLGMNHGAVAGQEIFHTHIHLMPRYSGQPRSFEKKIVDKQKLAEIAAIIREYLQST